MLPATWYTLGLDFCEISSKMTYTTQNTLSKLMPSTYVRRKIGIYVHNITPRPLSRTRRTPINLPKSVLEHCVITDLKHTVGGSAKVLLLSISPYVCGWVWEATHTVCARPPPPKGAPVRGASEKEKKEKQTAFCDVCFFCVYVRSLRSLLETVYCKE